MRKLLAHIFIAALSRPGVTLAQRTVSYDGSVVSQVRIDVRDLGYKPVDIIPDGESGIRSLVVAPNGDVYGATSGRRSHLFLLRPLHGYVQPIGVIPGADSGSSSIAISAAGAVYLGVAPSGHILKYEPVKEVAENIPQDRPVQVTDLGQAAPGESIATLAIDRNSNVLYGLTEPNAHFFRYALASGKFEDLGVVSRAAPFAERFEKNKVFSRTIAIDEKGNVFASGEDGIIYRFNATSSKLERLNIRVPCVPGRERWARVDAFVNDPSGTIYGASEDGYLFRLDPDNLTIANLGKALSQYRITGLVRAPNGKLYGVGGGDDDMARLFSYDPRSAVYDVLGFIDVDRRPYYTWQAYTVGAVAAGPEGTVYVGENERISKLYLFYP